MSTARTLIAEGKGILAADETPGTLTKRFDALGIRSTAESRRAYRELLFTAPDAGTSISGVIMQDETIRRKSSTGIPLAQLLASRGIVPGIKVDTGAKPLALAPGETVTEGLDGLRDRLAEYRGMGARFAKWRAVIHIADGLPSRTCVIANTHALARYAALCPEASLVPIVEPEVLMDGPHSIERCEEVTTMALHAVFHALAEQRISLESMLSNAIAPGRSRASWNAWNGVSPALSTDPGRVQHGAGLPLDGDRRRSRGDRRAGVPLAQRGRHRPGSGSSQP